MSQRIEGIFLRATKLNHLSTIVELYSLEELVLFFQTVKKHIFLFQPFHIIEFFTLQQ